MIATSIRRLGRGDEGVLEVLAADAADFGLSDTGDPLSPPRLDQSARYLSDPSLMHWVAFLDREPVGTLVAMVLPLPVAPGREVLLYEIGVRSALRRQGVGSALVRELDGWMARSSVDTVWVLADGDSAAGFYRACGFDSQDDKPEYMLRSTKP